VLSSVYDALVAEVHAWRGSVIGFSGDAITGWFDEGVAALGPECAAEPGAPAALRAASCALALQRVMAAFSRVQLPGGDTTALGLKVAVASGPARRSWPAMRQYACMCWPGPRRTPGAARRAFSAARSCSIAR
jgi:class 3 adenylate cyclase